MSDRNGGQILLAALRAYACDRIFGVPGESYLPLLDAIIDEPAVEFITCRHEAGACNMAEADAKLTGRPGVCAVSRGPGAMHAAIGLHTAQQDSTPLILLVGQVPRSDRGRGAFQEMDYRAVFGSIAKLVVEVEHPDDLPGVVERAYLAAMSGRRGPVVLSLPEDMLSARSSVLDRPPAWPDPVKPDPVAMDALRARLAAAERPLLIVGGSGWTDQACTNIRSFAHRHDMPIVAGFRCQDIVPNDDPLYAGDLGFGLSPALKGLIDESDLLLAVGERLGDVCTQGYTLIEAEPRQTLVHVLAEYMDLGLVFRPDLAILADIAPFASRAVALPSSQNAARGPWRQAARDAYLARREIPASRARARFVDPADVMAVLRGRLPSDAIITNGAGNYTGWVSRFHNYGGRGTQLAPVSGAMGYGLPAAIAAKLRYPERPVVAFAGDGCFTMAMSELATAIQYAVKIVVIVFNNGCYGSIAMHQRRQFGERSIGTTLVNPSFVDLAQSFGAMSFAASSLQELSDAADAIATADKTMLIEVFSDPEIISVGQ